MSGHPEDQPRQGFRLKAHVRAEIEQGGRSFSVGTQNLSRSGVLLVGELPTPLEGSVEIVLHAPTGNLTVRLKARIVRSQAIAEGGAVGVALEFVDMDDEGRDALEALLARLLEAPPTGGSLDSLHPGSNPQDIKAALEAIPLPQRIALASRSGLKEREFLRLDTHPTVLEALAHNPNLSVVEARALAASTFLMPGTLDALANNPRFKDDEELRMAIAVHPRVSMFTSERVTATMKEPQIRKLLTRPGLNLILREKLLSKLRR